MKISTLESFALVHEDKSYLKGRIAEGSGDSQAFLEDNLALRNKRLKI